MRRSPASRRLTQWSKDHPFIDALCVVPITLLATAMLTDWSLGLCLAVAVAAGVLVVPLAVRRRRRESVPTSH